ncbi:methyltransferase domain-containing protein [Methanospirillum hungatei]|uniref:class I SAM-dependent methyltransferase n=1 Tax=Methanospirillum hungatei TaxID=2203 RepID=UPI002CF707E9|nr:methyltransferase domain-containing protein [Methanospirillum hungatei]HOW06013.1 methyltransferase domain-containing protein [Methanospirillum hungatei]
MSSVHARVQSHYDDIADVYDQRYDHRERGRIYYDHIAGAVLGRINSSGHLLDIGCGTGLFLERYLKEGTDRTATGIDISPGMIKKARERYPDLPYVVGNAELLPFESDSFDSISSLLAFSYLQNPGQSLKDCYRVLVPGGRLAVCTLGKNIFTSSLPALYSIGAKMKIRRVGVGSFAEHYYSAKEMYDLLDKAGFEEIEIFKCSFAHFNLAGPLFMIAKKVESFIEDNIPYLAYNLIAAGKKPE